VLDICLSILIEIIEFSFVFCVYFNNHLVLNFQVDLQIAQSSILYAEQ